ncbi:MAG: ABC transporter ATP-binding protein, partial [Caulobacteraceae bacterium]
MGNGGMDTVTDRDGAALAFDQVVKRFGTFTALDDLSFEVPRGLVFGYLGGNGAGKTTSIRMALDILRPTGGRIEVLGRPPGRSLAPMIGFLPEERGLYRKMKVEDVLAYFGRLRGMAAPEAKRSAADLLDRFDLSGWASAKVEKLSKGMAQKVQLLSTIVHEPELLILDEPFGGLDPVNQQGLEEIIRGLAARGATVVFSTHVM